MQRTSCIWLHVPTSHNFQIVNPTTKQSSNSLLDNMKLITFACLLSAVAAKNSFPATGVRGADAADRQLGNDEMCLEASMSKLRPFDDSISGYVTVCFGGQLSDNSGTLVMRVEGLPYSIQDGGVHIHEGTSCAARGGHYYDTIDPWLKPFPENQIPMIAPSGTGYKTNANGVGRANFKFDQGYGYDLTVGKVVVIHNSNSGGYVKIACGVLEEV